MSRISVIIPNYNREDLIGKTISNLLAQTLPPHEIIVVDDGSTDKSVEVIRSFGERVKLLEQSNQGPGAARNAGLKIATGGYIQFQDSDDLLSLNKLEAQARLLDETGADVCFGPWAHVSIRDKKLAFQTCVLQQALPPSNVNIKSWLLRGWFTVLQGLLLRRAFLLGAGGYETDVRYGEDMEFLFRLLSLSPKVTYAGDALTLYRVNSAHNLSADGGASKERRIVDWARCLQWIDRHQNDWEQKPDGLSRDIFLAGTRKHLRYLRLVPNAPPDLLQDLSKKVSARPAWFLAILELWLRATERMRLFSTGQRWMPGLQPGPATESQMRLIIELGFEPSAK